MDFSEYKEIARGRGALAFEVYVVSSRYVVPPESAKDALPDHLAYIKQLESDGALMFAGPVSDVEGGVVEAGMIVLRAGSMAEARALADGDPMHSRGHRAYEIRRWLINEGSLTLRVGFASREARFV